MAHREELAAHFFVNPDSVHRWRSQGRIPKQFVRARGKRMEFRPDLIAYLTEHFDMCHKPPACKAGPPMSKPSGPFLVKEVAAELGLTEQGVRNLIEEGKLSAITSADADANSGECLGKLWKTSNGNATP